MDRNAKYHAIERKVALRDFDGVNGPHKKRSEGPSFGSLFTWAFYFRAGLVAAAMYGAYLAGDRLGVDPDWAAWAGLVIFAVGLGLVMVVRDRREQKRAESRLAIGLQRLGFANPDEYVAAVEARGQRVGKKAHRQLQTETERLLSKHAGKSTFRHAHHYEAVFQHVARQRGHDGSLDSAVPDSSSVPKPMKGLLGKVASFLGWLAALVLVWLAFNFGGGYFFGAEAARSAGDLLWFLLSAGGAVLLLASARTRRIGGAAVSGLLLVGLLIEPSGTVEIAGVVVIAAAALVVGFWILGGAFSAAHSRKLEYLGLPVKETDGLATEEEVDALARELGAPGLAALERAMVAPAIPASPRAVPAPAPSMRSEMSGSAPPDPPPAPPTEPRLEPSPTGPLPPTPRSQRSASAPPSGPTFSAPISTTDGVSKQVLDGYQRTKYGKLAAAVVLDVLGMSTYTLPLVGELGDLAWGPFAAFAGQMLFGRGKWSLFTLGEEMLPFTDIVPSVTMTWYKAYVENNKATLAAYCQEQRVVQRVVTRHG